MVDALGPGSSGNAVTVRPTRSISRALDPTWFKDCAGGQAGTRVSADFLNDFMAQLRVAFDSSGIVQDHADDMLWRAMQAAAPGFGDFFITVDTTKVYGPNAGADFATLSAALAWLKNKWIVPGVTVTLRQQAAVVNESTDVIVNHPQADRIAIVGNALPGAAPVPADFTIGGYDSPTRASNLTTNLAMLRTKFASELRFAAGKGFKVMGGRSLKLLDLILITGTGAGGGYGLYLDQGCALSLGTVAVANFDDGVYANAAAVTGSRLYVCGAVAGHGVSVFGGNTIRIDTQFVVAQCALNGVLLNEGSAAVLLAGNYTTAVAGGSPSYRATIGGVGQAGCAFVGGCEFFFPAGKIRYAGNYGAWSNFGFAIMPAVEIDQCALAGLHAGGNAYIEADYSNLTNCGTPADYYADGGGQINVPHRGNPSATFSPALNTTGNRVSLISG